MAEFQNVRTIDELFFLTGKVISPRLGFRSEILAAIGKDYMSPRGVSLGRCRAGDTAHSSLAAYR